MGNSKNEALAGKILFGLLIPLSFAGGAGLLPFEDFPMVVFVYAAIGSVVLWLL